MPDGGWTSVGLADAVDPITATAPREQLPQDAWLVGASDLDARGELIEARRVSHARARALVPFAVGDLLVSSSATHAKAWLANRDGACSGGLSVLRPTGRLESRYLLWGLRALGAAGTPLRRTRLERHRIPVPLDRSERANTIAILDGLATAMTARDRALELSGRLAAAIFDQRFGDPLAPQGRWQTATLGELLDRIETGWSPRCADRPAGRGEWGVIKLSAVSTGSFLSNENKALPPETAPRTELGLHAGDLLMVRSNTKALVGTTALVKHDYPNLLLADTVWRLWPRDDVDRVFLKGLLSHPSTRSRLSALATGSVASMQNLTQARLRELQVIRPPRARQLEFAAELQAVDGAHGAQQRQLVQFDRLMRQLLAMRFPTVERDEDPLTEVMIERALYAQLSPLQQVTWKVLVQADGPCGMPELSRRLAVHGITSHVDELRHALKVLTAAGAAVRSPSDRAYEWVQAQPEPLPDPA